ncbi:hypothetical protein PDK11_16635 [Bacillus cereus]|nr:hypothetical protein [Bacillus cereus]
MNRKIKFGLKGQVITWGILIMAILLISLCFFTTIDDGDNQNNIYYIFSTSAQTLAALVGFVLTAYIFTHQNLRNIKESDETLAEIVDETISKYYKLIFILSCYTAVTLIGDILMLQLNNIPYWRFRPFLFTLFSMLNVSGIILAFTIALYILRPFRDSELAKKIFDQETDGIDKPIKAGEFIEKFIELEQLITKSTEKMQFKGQKRWPTLRDRLQFLYISERIDKKELEALMRVIKFRNLVVHGQVTNIERDIYETLNELLNSLKGKLDA